MTLRVKLGDFLKTLGTDIDDRGTVKNITSDGKVDLMADNGVSAVIMMISLLCSSRTARDDCISNGPHENRERFHLQTSVCGQVGDDQDAWN